MTRTDKRLAKLGRVTRRNWRDKIYAITLILGGLVAAVITDDATALVLLTFFVAPLFFTGRRIYIK